MAVPDDTNLFGGLDPGGDGVANSIFPRARGYRRIESGAVGFRYNPGNAKSRPHDVPDCCPRTVSFGCQMPIKNQLLNPLVVYFVVPQRRRVSALFVCPRDLDVVAIANPDIK